MQAHPTTTTAPTSSHTTDGHYAVAVVAGGLARAASSRTPPAALPAPKKDMARQISQPLLVSTMPGIHETHTYRGDDDCGGRPPSGTRCCFDVTLEPPASSVSRRVLCVLLQLVLLGGYAVGCVFLGFFILLITAPLSETGPTPLVTPERQLFVTATATLVGIVGPSVALMSFCWAVATAVWPQKLPRAACMRFTLNTAPVLVHAVFVVMPFTIAVVKTQRYANDRFGRKLLL